MFVKPFSNIFYFRCGNSMSKIGFNLEWIVVRHVLIDHIFEIFMGVLGIVDINCAVFCSMILKKWNLTLYFESLRRFQNVFVNHWLEATHTNNSSKWFGTFISEQSRRCGKTSLRKSSHEHSFSIFIRKPIDFIINYFLKNFRNF